MSGDERARSRFQIHVEVGSTNNVSANEKSRPTSDKRGGGWKVYQLWYIYRVQLHVGAADVKRKYRYVNMLLALCPGRISTSTLESRKEG